MKPETEQAKKFKADFAEKIRKFVLDLIQFIDSLPNDRTCEVIGRQLIRSGTSIGANYFESRAASSKRDFINYFTHSLKSSNETRFWLETLIEAKKCSFGHGGQLTRQVIEIANVLAASVPTLKRSGSHSKF